MPFDMALRSETCKGTVADGLNGLLPRTSPIATKYLFWPVNESWTLYFDNSAGGTDAAPLSVLSSHLHTNSIRVVMAEQLVDTVTKQIEQYGATIFEYYVDGADRRHIFAANDGGKWKFGQSGAPFAFEDIDAYKERSVQKRFTPEMLLTYLRSLGIELVHDTSLRMLGSGFILTKVGKMPASLRMLDD